MKFDGNRSQIHKDGKYVALYSKNGNDFTSRFADIAYAVAHMPTKAVVLDAEITACADDGTPDFSALLERNDTGLCVWVFDLLSQFGKDARPLTLIARRWMLDKLMARVDIPTIRYSETFSDPNKLLGACSQRRLEGVVSKRLDRPYRSGPRKDWIKSEVPAMARTERLAPRIIQEAIVELARGSERGSYGRARSFTRTHPALVSVAGEAAVPQGRCALLG